MTEATRFELALNTPAADRPALLDRECAGDLALRDRVEALLAAHEHLEPISGGGPSPPPPSATAGETTAPEPGESPSAHPAYTSHIRCVTLSSPLTFGRPGKQRGVGIFLSCVHPQKRCVALIRVSVDRAHGLSVVATAPRAVRSPAAVPAPAGPTTPPTAPRNWLCSRAKLGKIRHLTANAISTSIAQQIGFVRAISAPPRRRPAAATRTTGGTAGHGKLRTGPESPSREIP
jgi:hypothetical protein